VSDRRGIRLVKNVPFMVLFWNKYGRKPRRTSYCRFVCETAIKIEELVLGQETVDWVLR